MFVVGKNTFKKFTNSPDWYGSVGWMSSHKAKDRWFDSQSRHMPGLWVQSPGRGTCEKQPIDVGLPPLPPLLNFFLLII